MNFESVDRVRAISWRDDCLQLLDQRLLPQQATWLCYNTVADVATAIRDMVVRGAPAIGITAAYGVVLAARQRFSLSAGHWQQAISEDLDILAASRPTAVNLFWALAVMKEAIAALPANDDPVAALLTLADKIHNDDLHANRRMGELGASLIKDPSAVLTHCNAGSLATGGFGTALGVIRAATAGGKITAVYADETRPWLQGARLTAWELLEDGIPVTLVAEGAAAALIRDKKIEWVIVGADRVAANGDVANKIGTYSLAVNARYHGIKMMVVAPTSTIDMATMTGADIPIESRTADELLMLSGQRIAAPGAQAWNPVFDVTPAELVSAIVTEKGIVERPTTAAMRTLMGR